MKKNQKLENLKLEAVEQPMAKAFQTRRDSFLVIGRCFRSIHGLRLWEQGKYSSFAEYVRQRWSTTPSRAYQWRRAIEVFDGLKSKLCPRSSDEVAMREGKLPSVERQLIELSSLFGASKNKPSLLPVLEVWDAVCHRAKAGEKVTCGLISEEVMSWRKRNIKMPLNRDRRMWYLNQLSPLLHLAKKEKDPQIRKMSSHLGRAVKVLLV